MEFRTPVHTEPFRQPIDHHRRGMLIGSCFTEEIGRRMQRLKFPVTVNPFGILFNPASIANTLDALQSGKCFGEEELVKNGDLWVSLHHHGSFSSPDKANVLQTINAAAESGHKALQEADYIILTLGTAWVYEYCATGEVAANCHKLPASGFLRRRLSVDEIVSLLSNALTPVKANQIILTVSPVRYAHDAVEDRLSKSTLIVAAAILAEQNPKIMYFPAYEIVVDELRDYRFYGADMLHVSETTAAYIWERFSAVALTRSSQDLCARITRLQEAAAHRPLNPGSDAHQAFREKMATEVRALQTAWPTLDFTPEATIFSDPKHG